MNKKGTKVLVGFVLFILIATLSPLVSCHERSPPESPASVSSNQTDSFTPTVWKPACVDQDNNGIADSLDREITDRMANGTVQDCVSVTVLLKAAPTIQDVEDFVSSGGNLTAGLWTKAAYGFGGTIKYDGIAIFVQRCPDVLLVEKEAVGEACVAYAAQQVGARTYVWSTLGLRGDANSSTAIIDTGIDGSHIDFSPGYGDQDFSKKIVGWNDQVGSTTAPVDDDGHGSHCAGLAAGNGFFSVDASGYATATWGGNLTGTASGFYHTGMMVNNSGSITVSVKWLSTGTAKLSELLLMYSGKSLMSWTNVSSVPTPSNNTWYTLTYNVSSPPLGGYDMYNPRVNVTGGTGKFYVTFNMSWPYTPPADGFSAWTGIAPQSKLVGVRVLSSADSTLTLTVFGNRLISGIDWIISNRIKYHITVASMSLGFGAYRIENSTIDLAVANLVQSGVTTIVSAGNDRVGDNYVYTPGSVDEVITAAAMNQFDNVASYSSQGGTSRYTGKTVKPDITAPGGSPNGVPLFSVDSNYNDAEGGFAEVQANDSAPMGGTSMAAPIIAGCAQVVIQAMGGYAKWNWTRSQALQPKMILLMTATETYPNLREVYSSWYYPTLDRGGKDRHEGFGRVNLDAATDALLRTYGIGSVATDTLGRPPTTTDISVVGQRLAWARNVQLISGFKYNFSLSVPVGADYDLYLYNNTGTSYGEPAIVARSTNETAGGIEQFWATPLYTGTYYIVVKRATESTGNGNFTLSSSSERAPPVNVTLNTPGLAAASNVVHYIQNGVSKNGSIVGGVFSDYVDILTTVTIDSPIFISTTQKYVATGPTAFTVQPNVNPVQENVIVESPHPYPNNYNNTWTLSRANATRIRAHFSYIWTELNYDWVYVRKNATTETSYSGFFSPFWSSWCDGNNVSIRLTSDVGIVYDGFFIDCLEWDLAPEAQNNYTVTYQLQTFSLCGVTAWYWTSTTRINCVAAGDTNGDGQTEIVTGGTYYDGIRNVAQLVIWNSSSLAVEKLTTWYWTGNTTINSLAVGDVDGDGQTEVVTGGYYYDGARQVAQLVVWNGSSLAAEKIKTWYWTSNTAINSVALGNVDGDAQVEIVTGGYYNDGIRNIAQLVVWTGSDLSVDRLTAWYWINNTVINSVVIGDVDADGQTEIVTGGAFNDGTRNVAQLVVWTGSGLAVDRLTAWYWINSTVINSVALGDVDADGQSEIVTAGYYNDGTRNVAQLVIWAGSALTVDRLTTWYWTGNTVINSVALGDVEGDAQVEIVTGGCYNDGTRNVAQLVVWSGSSLAVESIRAWYWVSDTVINSVCLSDINGDFSAEIVTGGAYNDGSRWNAQLVVWGMRQTV